MLLPQRPSSAAIAPSRKGSPAVLSMVSIVDDHHEDQSHHASRRFTTDYRGPTIDLPTFKRLFALAALPG